VQIVGLAVLAVNDDGPNVSTDNAQVDGEQVIITAQRTGILTRWTAGAGTPVRQGQVIGRIALQDSIFHPQATITAPATGVVAVSTVVNGQFVQPGARLAVAVDPAHLFVTARLDEDDVRRVRSGQQVDIDVEARPGVTLRGVVQSVQSSTAGELSRFPSSDVDPSNPQPVQQYVPVRVALSDPRATALVPGTDVTVRIHLDQ
jgi:multidrug resistance efflux pump